MTYKEFFAFVFTGALQENHFVNSTKFSVFTSCLLALLKVVALVLFIKVINVLLFQTDHDASTINKCVLYKIVFIVFLGPLVEELAFRLPLSFQKKDVLIALPFICFLTFVWLSRNTIFSKYHIFSGVVVLFLVIFYLVKNSKAFTFSPFFLMHVSAWFFAFVHWNNSKNVIGISDFERTIIYILPMLIMGYFLSFIRLKYGFIFSLYLHVIHNLIFTLPLIFKCLLK